MAAAVGRADLVSAEFIEIFENRDLATQNAALSVPKTFINGTATADMLQSEDLFIESLLQGKRADHLSHLAHEVKAEYDLAVIGGGPAGLTSAIYAQRSGLETIILERTTLGGQMALTPAIENYPGYTRIAGKTLVEMMAKQAMQYVPILEGAPVTSITQHKEGGFTLHLPHKDLKAKALILATGASHRLLNVPGEARLSGRGVSYCTTCDGYLYKDGTKVVVIGGGNSALTDALYLEGLGAHVTLVNRGSTLTGERQLIKRIEERNITVLHNMKVLEIHGHDTVEMVTVQDAAGKNIDLPAEGLFIAIGYAPNTEVARMLGLEIDKAGYIQTDLQQHTSKPLVYAAGDVTGGVKQITVAVGQGSIAAISAYQDLTKLPLKPSPSTK